MPARASISRRDSTDVVGMAVLVGAIAAMPVAFLGMTAIPLQESLAQGAGPAEALGSSLPTSEDWEILPFFLLAALLVGAVAAFVAALIWLAINARVPRLPWLAMAPQPVSSRFSPPSSGWSAGYGLPLLQLGFSPKRPHSSPLSE